MGRPPLGKIVFMLFFVFSTLAATWFLSWRLESLYGISQLLLFVLSYALCIAFIISSVYEHHKKSTVFSLFSYRVLALFIGLYYLSVVVLAVELLLSQFFVALQQYSAYLVPVLLVVLLAYSLFEAFFTRVHRVRLRLSTLEKPVRFALITDTHFGAVRARKFSVELASRIASLDVDALLISGDIFDGSGDPSASWTKPLGSLEMPVIAALGNHDQYIGADNAQKLLEDSGIAVLRGKVVKVKGVQIAGSDCPLTATGNTPDASLHKLHVDKTKPLVLLYHTPSALDDAQKIGVDLFLAGHTHRGQIFPMYLFTKSFFKHVYGLHRIKRMWLYVSCGVGCWGPTLRLGARSEIVVFELKP